MITDPRHAACICIQRIALAEEQRKLRRRSGYGQSSAHTCAGDEDWHADP